MTSVSLLMETLGQDLRYAFRLLVASRGLTAVAAREHPSRQSRFGEAADLKDGGHGAGASRSRLRHALVIAQVTACVVLLAGASLCLRSLSNASSIDPGFDTRHAVAASLNLEPFGYDAARGQAFYAALLDRVRAVPGVRAAAYADHLPLGQTTRMERVEPDGYDAPAGPTGPIVPAIDVALVSPGYFEAIGTPIVAGRGFTNGDNAGAPPVIVINERMAERFWPHQDAVGRFVTFSGPNRTRVRAEVVGIAKTGRYSSLGEDPKPYSYQSLLQSYQPGLGLIVRTEGDAPVLDAVRHEVRALDPRLALTGVQTLEQHMQLPLFPARAAGLLLGLFGFLALSLAVVGLYGVMSFGVSQRIREIGVRMALGARPRDVLRLVVWQGFRLTLIGLGLGLALAAAGTRVLSNVLYGIAPTDPLSYGAVILVLTLAALLASYVPARWATRVDPIRALRTQ